MRAKCDVAIIGAGSAGLSAFDEARNYFDKVVLIEKGPYGTTCARVGCMPSKLLIAASDSANHIREAVNFGIQTTPPVIEGKKVLKRVRNERDRFVNLVKKSITDDIPHAANITGKARFINRHCLEISDYGKLEFATAIIATGARPKIPEKFAEVTGTLLFGHRKKRYEGSRSKPNDASGSWFIESLC